MGETTIKIIVHVTNRLENSCSAGVTIMVAPVAWFKHDFMKPNLHNLQSKYFMRLNSKIEAKPQIQAVVPTTRPNIHISMGASNYEMCNK